MASINIVRSGFGILLIGASMFLAPAAGPAASDVDRLQWMRGRWVGEKGGVRMEEHWIGPLGGALLRVHGDVKAGRLVSWEFFRIDASDEGVFYYASPRSAPPTPFKLVEMESRRVVFENKTHDFPQRILYWLDGQEVLHARIEGTRSGAALAEEWAWRRRP
jgi:hypothetical protein